MTLDILVVDDLASMRKCLILAFADHTDKIRCEEAKSGQIALDMFKARYYDIVILVYNMAPGINGYETAQELRKVSSDVKLVGFSSSWAKQEANTIGIDFFSGSLREVVAYVNTLL